MAVKERTLICLDRNLLLKLFFRTDIIEFTVHGRSDDFKSLCVLHLDKSAVLGFGFSWEIKVCESL